MISVPEGGGVVGLERQQRCVYRKSTWVLQKHLFDSALQLPAIPGHSRTLNAAFMHTHAGST